MFRTSSTLGSICNSLACAGSWKRFITCSDNCFIISIVIHFSCVIRCTRSHQIMSMDFPAELGNISTLAFYVARPPQHLQRIQIHIQEIHMITSVYYMIQIPFFLVLCIVEIKTPTTYYFFCEIFRIIERLLYCFFLFRKDTNCGWPCSSLIWYNAICRIVIQFVECRSA